MLSVEWGGFWRRRGRGNGEQHVRLNVCRSSNYDMTKAPPGNWNRPPYEVLTAGVSERPSMKRARDEQITHLLRAVDARLQWVLAQGAVSCQDCQSPLNPGLTLRAEVVELIASA